MQTDTNDVTEMFRRVSLSSPSVDGCLSPMYESQIYAELDEPNESIVAYTAGRQNTMWIWKDSRASDDGYSIPLIGTCVFHSATDFHSIRMKGTFELTEEGHIISMKPENHDLELGKEIWLEIKWPTATHEIYPYPIRWLFTRLPPVPVP